MTQSPPEAGALGGATGSGDVCSGGEHHPAIITPQKNQATGSYRAVPHLRLVPASPPPPRPRLRYEVRIAVSAARAPIARSRAFRLTERDVAELIALVERLEARPA
jgi:hypothetical protein